MSGPPFVALAHSKNGSQHIEDHKSRGRFRLWRKAKHRHRHRNADCSRSLSPTNHSHWELEYSTSHDFKEEDAVLEGIITSENYAFPSLSKPRGSTRLWNLKEFFLCSSWSGSSEKVRDERLPFSSYANSYFSSPSDKENKRASAEEKLGQKKRMDNKTLYISNRSRKGVPVSAHELHYIANRAQAEELRKKTFLPYRQSVLGCLGFLPPSPQGHMFQSP